MTRTEAFNLMVEYTKNESLQRHMLAVETCMRWYAAKMCQDKEEWGIAGLLHDFDYERFPDEHPLEGIEILKKSGVNEKIINAIAAHYPQKTGIEPCTTMAKVLFACDELSGFISACCYVRPEKIHGLTPKSVLKKLKSANFAAGVSRSDVQQGAHLLNLQLNEHIQNCIDALTENADSLGLA